MAILLVSVQNNVVLNLQCKKRLIKMLFQAIVIYPKR